MISQTATNLYPLLIKFSTLTDYTNYVVNVKDDNKE